MVAKVSTDNGPNITKVVEVIIIVPYTKPHIAKIKHTLSAKNKDKDKNKEEIKEEEKINKKLTDEEKSK